MINTGENESEFVDWVFMHKNHVKICSLDQRILLCEFNEKTNTDDYITHVAKVILYIQNYKKRIWLLVTNLKSYNIILEWFWMKLHEVISDYHVRIIKFTAEWCTHKCFDNLISELKPDA